MKKVVSFRLEGIPCAIDLERVGGIRAPEPEDLDLHVILGLRDVAQPQRAGERSLELGDSGRGVRVGTQLSFGERDASELSPVPTLAAGHPWVAGLLLDGAEAPVLWIQPTLDRVKS